MLLGQNRSMYLQFSVSSFTGSSKVATVRRLMPNSRSNIDFAFEDKVGGAGQRDMVEGFFSGFFKTDF